MPQLEYLGDLPGNIRADLPRDINAALEGIEHFLEYRLPHGTLRNLQAAERELKRSLQSIEAAAVIASMEVTK